MGGFSRVRSTSVRIWFAVGASAALCLVLAAPAQAVASAPKANGAKGSDVVPLCGQAPKGQSRCFALRRTDVTALDAALPADRHEWSNRTS